MNSFKQRAADLDKKDELAIFREKFLNPSVDNNRQIYFLGNSLGLQPRSTSDQITEVLIQWQKFGVEGFFAGDSPWLKLHEQLTEKLAPIVGALPSELAIMNQLTVNLHLMLVSFYQPKGKRRKIICEAKAFPSDQYMLHSHLQSRGIQPEDVIIEVHPRPGSHLIEVEDIYQAIEVNKEELALVFLGGVNYYSGQLFPLAEITARAHSAGAICGFDLAHAAGNVFLDLHNWGVDFACWCSYKYLNSGPGAIAAAFIHERYHHDQGLNRFTGWWGYTAKDRFLMRKDFSPEPTAEGWQLSTPSILLFACHMAALELFEQATMKKLLRKSRGLSAFVFDIIEDINLNTDEAKIKVLTPRDPEARGAQISLSIPEKGKQVFKELQANNIFSDWREPDVIRIAPAPFYNTYSEIYQFGEVLRTILTQKR